MQLAAKLAASLTATPPKTEIVFQNSCQACFVVKEETRKPSSSGDLNNVSL